MPNHLRIPALGAAIAMLAACSSPTTGAISSPTATTALSSPAVTASPAATSLAPSPPPTPRSSVVPPPSMAPGCVPLDQTDLGTLEVTLGNVDTKGNGGQGIWPGQMDAHLQVTRVTELSGPQRSVTPATHHYDDRRGLLLGGHEFVTFLFTWYDGRPNNPEAFVSADVVLTLDGKAPRKLQTRLIAGNENFDQLAVTVPDTTGAGILSMDLVWTDGCFRFEGSAAIPVDVVAASTTAGCALERDSYFDQIDALLEGALRIGSTTVRAFSPRNEAKFLSWGNPGIDAFLVYAFDRDQPAIDAAPGVALTIEQASSNITLGKDMTLTVWTRASVARAVKDYPPQGTVLVLSRTPVKQADGTFRLRVPDEPGRYVAGVTLHYDSQCSSGDVWFVVNIDVVAPSPSPVPSAPPPSA